MLDYRTVVLYGWKLEGDDVNKFENDLEAWDEDYYDEAQEVLVEDTMCGDYTYVGAILVYFDPTEDNQEVIINDELINKATAKFNKYLKENPEFENILNQYKNGEPQLYAFNHIW